MRRIPWLASFLLLLPLFMLLGCDNETQYLSGPVGIVEGAPARHGLLAISLSQQPGRSLEVVDVIAGSPAAEAGILPGDIITTFEGNPVADYPSLIAKLESTKPGAIARVGYERNGELNTVSVRLLSFAEVVELQQSPLPTPETP